MFHENRIWCVAKVASEEELAYTLTEYTMCCCCGFEFGGYLLLNDSTSADGAQEYFVCKRPVSANEPYRQAEHGRCHHCA